MSKKKVTMKIYRGIILNILLWGSFSVVADEYQLSAIEPTPFQGFYLSGGAGMQRNIASLYDGTTVFVNRLVPSLLGSNEIFTKPKQTEGNGALLFGYGLQVTNSNFYIGMQLGLNFGNYNFTEHNTTSFSDNRATVNVDTTINTKMNTTEFFVDFKPGIILGKDVLFSGIVGFALNEAKTDFASTTSSDNFSPVHAVGDRTKNVIGLRVGASIEKMLSDYWSIGFNYIYTKYGVSVSSSADQISDDRWPISVSKDISSKFRKRAAMVTVSRYFV